MNIFQKLITSFFILIIGVFFSGIVPIFLGVFFFSIYLITYSCIGERKADFLSICYAVSMFLISLSLYLGMFYILVSEYIETTVHNKYANPLGVFNFFVNNFYNFVGLNKYSIEYLFTFNINALINMYNNEIGLMLLFGGICISGFAFWIFTIGGGENQRNIRNIKKSKFDVKGSKVSMKYDVMPSSKLSKVNILKEHIGVSYSDYSIVSITQKMLNKMMLFIGSTGSGKSETLRNLYNRWILKKQFSIIVDGKPDADNIAKLQALADKNNVPFYGFNCANNLSYDFLNNGSPTVIKDKIIGLKDEASWSSDHYKTRGEVYLQTAIEVLQQSKERITLEDVIDGFDYDYLVSILKDDASDKLKKQLLRMKDIDAKDLLGIRDMLILLSHSDMGDYLSTGKNNEFDLSSVRDNGGFVYFALPSLQYPSFAKVLGKMVINDIKTMLAKGKPVNCVFDEFSVFAGEQVLNLINQGRGLGLYCGFGTQSTSDLSKVSPTFKDIFIANMNSILVQLVNDSKTVDDVVEWAGKMEAKEYTASINNNNDDVGNVRVVQKEIVQHGDITRQPEGDGYLMTKVGGFSVDKIRVNYLGK